MVLMVAMAVPGNGPERVSGETEQGLDLRGEWEGVLVWLGRARPVVLSGETLWWRRKGSVELWSIDCMIDEGGGKFRFKWVAYPTHGIYERRPDTILMCYGSMSEGRPSAFEVGKNRELLILHRVKPRR
jgi:hypothetical protein